MTNANNSDLSLMSTLSMLDDKYRGDDIIHGITALSYVSHIDSGRAIMHAAHEQQKVVLKTPEFPSVFGNWENIVGEYSSYNNRTDSDLDVIAVVNKFDEFDTTVQPCLIFVYNKERQIYDVITRKDVENLTEKYGFEYRHDRLNNLKSGDVIEKGSVLYRPTSFDEFGNYCTGRNLTFMYLIDNDTIEDAIKISDDLQDDMMSSEIEQVKVTINDNDCPINIYGDNSVYKAFPNIGEKIKNKQLMSKRRLSYSQILFDFSDHNTQEIMPSDTTVYMDGTVVDIDIFCNKKIDEIEPVKYNDQLLRYIGMSNRYYTRIKEITNNLINNDDGIPVSDNIRILNKRAKQLTDPDIKIKDDNKSEFSNIVMYFTVKRDSGLSIGQKLTGRYGNKGVVSKMEHHMPIVDMGNGIYKKVDIIFNALGVYGRLTGFVMMEQSITFITGSIVNYMKNLPRTDVTTRENLMFKVIQIFNDDEHDKIKQAYEKSCPTKKDKMEYFDIVEKHGIFIHIKPFWHPKNIYECVLECYKEFPFIKPYDVWFYNEPSDRYVKMILPQVVGTMYILKLKQTAKKGLSVRSTGPISKKGIPEKKSAQSAKNFEPYSKTAIRFGIQELLNQWASVPEDVIAEEHLLYRSSVIGRRELARSLMSNYGENNDIKITENMTNRNVEILSAYFMLLGFELLFEHDEVDLSPGNGIKTHIYHNRRYICTTDEMKQIIAKDITQGMIDRNEPDAIYVGPEVGLEEFCDELTSRIADHIDDYLK